MVSQTEAPAGSPAGVPHESPSLSAAANPALPAYELKYLLTEPEAAAVEAMLRGRLALDPHADPTLGDAYRVTSVYYDSPRLDIYRRAAGSAGRKFRLRRYGADPAVYLEKKAKDGGRVWKWRTAVPLGELDQLTDGRDGWPGAWFARHLAERDLRPACRVTYARTAFVGAGPDGPIRLTLDRSLRGLATTDHRVDPVADGLPLLAGEVVLEFKFFLAMPALFKGVIEALRLSRPGASKYRRCVEAAGLAAGVGDDA